MRLRGRFTGACTGAVMWTATISCLTGCTGFGFGSNESQVAQGELYRSGDSEYDAFFREVHDVQSEAESGSEGEPAHAPLRDALGLKKSASSTKALDETQKRVTELKEGGLLLHLQITPEPKLVRVQEKQRGPIDDELEALFEAVEQAASDSLEDAESLRALRKRTTELEKKRAKLVKSGEPDKGKLEVSTKQLQAELEASEAVLANAASTFSAQAGDAAWFVVELARAVESGGADAKPPPPPAPKPKKPAWRPRPRVKPKPPPADFDP